MIEAAIIVPRIEPGGNSLQTAKSGSTGTEIPLNRVVVLVTTIQIISFDYHGSKIFEDKHDEICLAGSHDNKLYLSLEIRQDRASTFVCSSISAKPRANLSAPDIGPYLGPLCLSVSLLKNAESKKI